MKVDKYNQFKEALQNAATVFKNIDTNETIRVISHFDCDGICSASIITKALMKLNMKYSLSIVPSLSEEFIKELSEEEYHCFVFTDIGSGQIEFIAQHLAGKNVFILDHHEYPSNPHGIVHVNPHIFGIDGGKELSGAGVTYFFSQCLADTEMAHIALIGAIGDVQNSEGFSRLNNEIIEQAKADGTVKVIKGLRMFGAQTRALYKVLEYSTDIHIPGVTGSESGALQFLQQIGIDPKQGNGWKKIIDLTEDEIQRLTAAIVMKRVDEDAPEDVVSDVYILKEEEKGSPFRDVKEFSTLLNACGRMDRAAIGVGCCLNDVKAKKKALATLVDYRREIVGALRWFEANEDSDYVHKENGFIIINARDQIKHTVIGTLASILSKSNKLKDDTFILSMAHSPEQFTKASLRISGISNGHDLRQLMTTIAEQIPECEAGGHTQAAGATFPLDQTSAFVEKAKEVLKGT